MSDKSAIEWTDATWNPVTGCTKVSPGCDHCYAETLAERFRGTTGHYFENGFDVQLRPNKLTLPLGWKKPRRVFVNSMSDLFHDDIPDGYIAEVFAVMAATRRHTFQVLTKRHARMRSLISSESFFGLVTDAVVEMDLPVIAPWPLPNVWLGVSVEDQKWANIRIPALLDTPAAVRFLSCEPLLGPVSLFENTRIDTGTLVDWVIVGGESGRGARPMHPDWARGLRNECATYGIPFLHKQNGAWIRVPVGDFRQTDHTVMLDGAHWPLDQGSATYDGTEVVMRRVGKHAAGRQLDGRTWDQYPAAAS